MDIASNFKFEPSTEWQIEDNSWISKVCKNFYVQVASPTEYLLWEDTFDVDGCYTHHKTCTNLKQAMIECHAMAKIDNV